MKRECGGEDAFEEAELEAEQDYATWQFLQKQKLEAVGKADKQFLEDTLKDYEGEEGGYIYKEADQEEVEMWKSLEKQKSEGVGKTVPVGTSTLTPKLQRGIPYQAAGAAPAVSRPPAGAQAPTSSQSSPPATEAPRVGGAEKVVRRAGTGARNEVTSAVPLQTSAGISPRPPVTTSPAGGFRESKGPQEPGGRGPAGEQGLGLQDSAPCQILGEQLARQEKLAEALAELEDPARIPASLVPTEATTVVKMPRNGAVEKGAKEEANVQSALTSAASGLRLVTSEVEGKSEEKENYEGNRTRGKGGEEVGIKITPHFPFSPSEPPASPAPRARGGSEEKEGEGVRVKIFPHFPPSLPPSKQREQELINRTKKVEAEVVESSPKRGEAEADGPGSEILPKPSTQAATADPGLRLQYGVPGRPPEGPEVVRKAGRRPGPWPTPVYLITEEKPDHGETEEKVEKLLGDRDCQAGAVAAMQDGLWLPTRPLLILGWPGRPPEISAISGRPMEGQRSITLLDSSRSSSWNKFSKNLSLPLPLGWCILGVGALKMVGIFHCVRVKLSGSPANWMGRRSLQCTLAYQHSLSRAAPHSDLLASVHTLFGLIHQVVDFHASNGAGQVIVQVGTNTKLNNHNGPPECHQGPSAFPGFCWTGGGDLLEVIGDSKRIAKRSKKMFAGLATAITLVMEEERKREKKVTSVNVMAWLDAFTSQISALSTQVLWSEQVKKVLARGLNRVASIDEVLALVVGMLGLLTTYTLQELPPLRRKEIQNLIGEYMHKGSWLGLLIKNQKASNKDFEWLCPMCFYHNPKHTDVLNQLFIHMADANFNYVSKDQGLQQKPARTSRNDWRYIVVTQALEAHLDESAFGLASICETDVIKALSDQLGRICVGICRKSTWACFDGFNRLEEKLALKIATFFRLCDEQLKQQGHYDSALKASMSALTVSDMKHERIRQIKAEMMATSQSFNEAKITENLPEQNIPIQPGRKTMEGVPLSFPLLNDLFPGAESQMNRMDACQEEDTRTRQEEQPLCRTDKEESQVWMKKVIQLYEIQKQIMILHHDQSEFLRNFLKCQNFPTLKEKERIAQVDLNTLAVFPGVGESFSFSTEGSGFHGTPPPPPFPLAPDRGQAMGVATFPGVRKGFTISSKGSSFHGWACYPTTRPRKKVDIIKVITRRALMEPATKIEGLMVEKTSLATGEQRWTKFAYGMLMVEKTISLATGEQRSIRSTTKFAYFIKQHLLPCDSNVAIVIWPLRYIPFHSIPGNQNLPNPCYTKGSTRPLGWKGIDQFQAMEHKLSYQLTRERRGWQAWLPNPEGPTATIALLSSQPPAPATEEGEAQGWVSRGKQCLEDTSKGRWEGEGKEMEKASLEVEKYYRLDGWPLEADKGLTFEDPVQQEAVLRISLIGLSKAHPVIGQDCFALGKTPMKRVSESAMDRCLHTLAAKKGFPVPYSSETKGFRECLWNRRAHTFPETISPPLNYQAQSVAIEAPHWQAWQLLFTSPIKIFKNSLELKEQMLKVDCTVFTPEPILAVFGHVERFADLMARGLKNEECFHLDHLIKAALGNVCADKDFMARIQMFLSKVGMIRTRLRSRQHMGSEMGHFACNCNYWDAELLTSYGWMKWVGCADRSACYLTQYSAATGTDSLQSLLCAETRLLAPVTKNAIQLTHSEGPLNETFMRAAQTVIDCLATLSLEEMTKVKEELAELEEGGTKVSLTPDMVAVKKYRKTVYVEEIIPSNNTGRVMHALFKVREGDELSAYFPLPPDIGPLLCLALGGERKQVQKLCANKRATVGRASKSLTRQGDRVRTTTGTTATARDSLNMDEKKDLIGDNDSDCRVPAESYSNLRTYRPAPGFKKTRYMFGNNLVPSKNPKKSKKEKRLNKEVMQYEDQAMVEKDAILVEIPYTSSDDWMYQFSGLLEEKRASAFTSTKNEPTKIVFEEGKTVFNNYARQEGDKPRDLVGVPTEAVVDQPTKGKVGMLAEALKNIAMTEGYQGRCACQGRLTADLHVTIAKLDGPACGRAKLAVTYQGSDSSLPQWVQENTEEAGLEPEGELGAALAMGDIRGEAILLLMAADENTTREAVVNSMPNEANEAKITIEGVTKETMVNPLASEAPPRVVDAKQGTTQRIFPDEDLPHLLAFLSINAFGAKYPADERKQHLMAEEGPKEGQVGLVSDGREQQGKVKATSRLVAPPDPGSIRVNWEKVKVKHVSENARKAVRLREGERQALWTILRAPFKFQFKYWLGLCYPSDVLLAAQRVNTLLHEVLEAVAGQHITGLSDRSFQSWLTSLPVRKGGRGMVSRVELIPAAFLGSLEWVLPFFVWSGGEGGVWPYLVEEEEEVTTPGRLQLQNRQGIGDCLGRHSERGRGEPGLPGGGAGGERFPPFHAYGWGWGGDTTGTTRKGLTRAREELRLEVFTRAISLHHNQQENGLHVTKDSLVGHKIKQHSLILLGYNSDQGAERQKRLVRSVTKGTAEGANHRMLKLWPLVQGRVKLEWPEEATKAVNAAAEGRRKTLARLHANEVRNSQVVPELRVDRHATTVLARIVNNVSYSGFTAFPGLRKKVDRKVVLKRNDDGIVHAAIDLLTMLMEPRYQKYGLGLKQFNKFSLLSSNKFLDGLFVQENYFASKLAAAGNDEKERTELVCKNDTVEVRNKDQYAEGHHAEHADGQHAEGQHAEGLEQCVPKIQRAPLHMLIPLIQQIKTIRLGHCVQRLSRRPKPLL